MTLSQRLERLRENWVAIIVSLIAAIFLYFFYQISQLDTITLSVPVKVESEGNLLPVNNIKKYIKITLKGKPEEMTKLSEKDFTPVLNLNNIYKAGHYTVPINIQLSALAEKTNPLEIRLNPQSVEVILEEKVINYVPVDAFIVGTPAEGYEVKSTQVEPNLVRIVGSTSAVAAVSSIQTDVINLDGIKESFVTTVDLVNLNKQITIDNVSSVEVSVDIGEIIEDKTYENVSITLLNPAEGLEVISQTKNASITVNGSKNYLANYKLPYGTIFVDCSFISEPGEYEVPLSSHKLSKLNTVALEPATIKVVVSLKETEQLVEESIDKNTTEEIDSTSTQKTNTLPENTSNPREVTSQ